MGIPLLGTRQQIRIVKLTNKLVKQSALLLLLTRQE